MFHITKFTLSDRIYPIEYIILKLKVYCGSDTSTGRPKFGQYDKEKNRVP